ncbi:MAG: SH3 domain-containing protein [Micropruina sp.]|nr:MAG: SH3 domain-containing protein [Micropruina sp.]
MSPSNNPLRLRSKPSTSAKVLATIKRGTTVTLTCAATGSRVRGPEGDSTTWHKVTHSGKTGFLSAAYLRGGDNPLVPRCSDGSATTPRSPAAPNWTPTSSRSLGDRRRSRRPRATARRTGSAARGTGCSPPGCGARPASASRSTPTATTCTTGAAGTAAAIWD